MEFDTKNKLNLDLNHLSLKSKVALMLACIDRMKVSFLEYERSTLYRMIDRALTDFWLWTENDEIIDGDFMYFDLSNKLHNNTFLGASYLYYNHNVDLDHIIQLYGSNKAELIVIMCGLDSSIKWIEFFDINVLHKKVSLPSDMYEVGVEYFFATLNYSIKASENPEKEHLWQQAALDKLLAEQHVDLVGEWGPPIAKDFFEDIVV